MVSGAAPWKSVVTVTTGRSTLGNSRISTPNSAANPASTIRAETTSARIGRRTNSAGPPPSAARVASSSMAGSFR